MDDTPRRTALAHQPFHGVLDLRTGDGLTLQEFIGDGDYGDLIEKRRLALEHDLIEGQIRYVCQTCRQPMVLRSLAVEKDHENRFFLKHRFRSDCVGFKGLSHEAICALKYANTKESVAHRAYKALIVASLEADPAFSDTRLEATWFAQDGVRWRKPDVQTVREAKRIALEVQLSTTFVEVVAQRQAFYRENVGQLIWFFRDLAIGGFRQAEDDIFFNNNRNAFLISEETLALSEKTGRMAMECAWQVPRLEGDAIAHSQHRQVVFFDQLTFDVKDGRIPRAYFFDYDAARAPLEADLERRKPPPATRPALPTVDFQTDAALRDLMEEFIRGYPNHVDNLASWSLVRARYSKRGFKLPEHIRFDPVFPALQAAYSAKLGRPVGCAQVYLIELANTLFNSHKAALWVFSVMMAHYDRASLLIERGDKRAWLDKVRQYHQAWIDDEPDHVPDDSTLDLLGFLFPDAEAALREDPALYVVRRRATSSRPTARPVR